MDIGKLLENKLFLQYLAGAGGAMSAGEPIGPTLNQITQQNIAAQSQATVNEKTLKMLTEMMSGKLLPGSSMKKGLDGKITLDIPGNAFSGGGTPAMNEAARMQSTGIVSTEPTGGATRINPFLLTL